MNKGGVVPKLRFSEFGGEWEIKPFNEIYSFKMTNSFSRDKLNYDKGTIKNIHYGDIHTKFSILFDITKERVPYINNNISLNNINLDNYCIEGDMVLADASEDLDDIGKSIEIINLNNEKLLSGLHTFLARQVEQKIIIGFGGYLFKSNSIRTQIKREAQGTKVLGISKGRTSNIKIYYPESKKEQQKIAHCLSSLDNLINAETTKLDTLKVHKKGLLQQLFPAEGKTLPQLRFPEFIGDRAWEKNFLSNIATFSKGKGISKSDIINNGNKLCIRYGELYTRYNEVIKDVFSKTNLPKEQLVFSQKNDVIIPSSGETQEDIATASCILENGIALGGDINIIRSNINGIFLSYYLNNAKKIEIAKIAQGNTIVHLYLSQLEKLEIETPSPKEEQKIAQCLTSLDELITTQTQKIATLKEHKKGLIQQLFPNIDKVNT